MDIVRETQLTSIARFKNDLTGEECSLEDYGHAQRAWSEFECQTFSDFMLAYLKLDVYLLTDVFETFRHQALGEDELDPVHFVSLPHMTFVSAFKMTRESIHLLQDLEMYNMFERGIRRGLTFMNKHFARHKTTSKYTRRLAYIDQNNLYGSALSKPLPHSNFKWVDEETLEHLSNAENILKLDSEGDVGYYFEIDLIYPDNIKNNTKDFPLAPESGYVSEDMFSPFMKQLRETLDFKFRPTRKLLMTQTDRYNYRVHYSILKFYLEMGMKIRKVHRIIQFNQKPFLKPYIDYNSRKRAQAQNAFQKDYFKLKNNALFGKTMEDVRKRTKYDIILGEEKLEKIHSSPFYHSTDIITEDLFGVKCIKPMVTLDKPIFIGQAVLDYSKLEMYRLYYQTLRQCPVIRHVDLIGGDTDSFLLALKLDIGIRLNDVFLYLRDQFDSSNYPSTHPLYSIENKAKLGCFKDECAGERIKQMVLLRPKMYSILLKDKHIINRAKGISKHIVHKMTHEKYLDVLLDHDCSEETMTIIHSKNHHVTTKTFKKRGLSP